MATTTGKRLAADPKRYDAAKAREFCERITQGFSVYQVCQERGMPSRSIVKGWKKRVPSFEQMIEEAIEDRPAGFVERITMLADKTLDRADKELPPGEEEMSRGEARAHYVGANLLATACRLSFALQRHRRPKVVQPDEPEEKPETVTQPDNVIEFGAKLAKYRGNGRVRNGG